MLLSSKHCAQSSEFGRVAILLPSPLWHCGHCELMHQCTARLPARKRGGSSSRSARCSAAVRPAQPAGATRHLRPRIIPGTRDWARALRRTLPPMSPAARSMPLIAVTGRRASPSPKLAHRQAPSSESSSLRRPAPSTQHPAAGREEPATTTLTVNQISQANHQPAGQLLPFVLRT